MVDTVAVLVDLLEAMEDLVDIHHIHPDSEDTQEQHHIIVFIHHQYQLIHWVELVQLDHHLMAVNYFSITLLKYFIEFLSY